MRPLKLSTEKTVRIGPYVDKTDGVTSEAGLAGAGTEISKAGGAFGAGPTLGTYDSDGWYPITLTTSHTDTIGELVIKGVDDATHLPVWETFTVLPAVVFDALFATAATDYLQVDVVQIAGAAVSTSSAQLGVNVVNAAGTAWGSGAITAASIATGAIDADSLAADAGTEIATAVWASADRQLTALDEDVTTLDLNNTAVGSVTSGVTLANGAHGGAAASLTLGGGATISNASGSALTLSSSGGNGSGLVCTGNGTGKGIIATGGTSGAGISAVGGATANGYGIYAEANSADCYGLQAVGKGATESGGIKGSATTSGEGIEGLAAGNGHGLYVVGAGTGEGIHATAGGGANGHGAHFEGVGANSHGLLLSRGGAGGDDLAFANNDVTVATVTSVTGIGTGGIAAASFAAGAINAAAIATGAIDADAIADNAIDAGAIATGAITAAKFAAGAIDAAAIADNAIDAAALAADAGTELGTAVWATVARTLTAATNVTSTGAAVPITAGGYVSADVKAINATVVDGAGTGGDPWGPA